MYQSQNLLFHLCCLKQLIRSLIDLSEPYFRCFKNQNLFNQVHLSQAFSYQLNLHHQLQADFYSFIKEFFSRLQWPFLLKLQLGQQIFLFPYLKQTKFILEQFYLNSIAAIAVAAEEQMLFYLGSISYIVHKLSGGALFHNQVIFLVLTNCFIMKKQLIYHNFSKFHLHRVLYIKLCYMVQDAKRMDRTYHFLLQDKFLAYILSFNFLKLFL